jgi:hypothetical protein
MALIAAGAAGALLTALLLRTRLSAAAVLVLLVAFGACIGAGALIVQDRPGLADWAVTVPLVALLLPAHVRILLGRFGPAGRSQSSPALQR